VAEGGGLDSLERKGKTASRQEWKGCVRNGPGFGCSTIEKENSIKAEGTSSTALSLKKLHNEKKSLLGG